MWSPTLASSNQGLLRKAGIVSELIPLVMAWGIKLGGGGAVDEIQIIPYYHSLKVVMWFDWRAGGGGAQVIIGLSSQ